MVEKSGVEKSGVGKFMVEKSGVGKFMVEKSGVERSGIEVRGLKCPSTFIIAAIIIPVHRGWKGIFDSFSKMIFKKSFYKNKNSQKI